MQRSSPPESSCCIRLGALAWLAEGSRLKPPTSEPFNYGEVSVPAPCLVFISSICLPPLLHPQGFQVVCEAAQSGSSSPIAAEAEQSCPRGNSVEKGGPSQQQQQQQQAPLPPPPVKGPSKKK